MIWNIGYVAVAMIGIVTAVIVLPALPSALLIGFIGLVFVSIQAWTAAATFAVMFLLGLLYWHIEKKHYVLPNFPRTLAGPTQPKTKEIVMNFGPLFALIAAVINFLCCVVLFQMYYLGVTEWRMPNGFVMSYFVFATPAVLVIALANDQSAKHRSGSWLWRMIDGVSSATLMVFVWITLILSTFVIGLPSSVPTPVLSSVASFVIIGTLAVWTLYDVFANQRRNMHELLVKYPNARIIFGSQEANPASTGSVGAGIGTSSMSLAEAIASGKPVGSAVGEKSEWPVDFHIVPYLVMPNGDRVRLQRMPEMIDVTPADATQAAGAPAQELARPPLN